MKNLQIVLRAKWMLQKPYNFFLSWTPTHCSFTHCDSNISQSTSFLSVKEWRIFNFWFCFIFTKVCFFVQQKGWTLRGYSRKIFLAAIPYARHQITNAVWVHAQEVPVMNPDLDRVHWQSSGYHNILSVFNTF